MLRLNGITIYPATRVIATVCGALHFRCANNSKYIKQGHSAQFDLICRLMIGPPATYDEMWEAIYGHDPNGGPDGGTKTFEVTLNHLKPKLEKLGLRLHKEKVGRGRCRIEFRIAP